MREFTSQKEPSQKKKRKKKRKEKKVKNHWNTEIILEFVLSQTMPVPK